MILPDELSLVEYAVFHPPDGMEDWRCYRVEYGHDENGFALVEGILWLPGSLEDQVKTLEEIRKQLGGE